MTEADLGPAGQLRLDLDKISPVMKAQTCLFETALYTLWLF
jgi:hypothetical protein